MASAYTDPRNLFVPTQLYTPDFGTMQQIAQSAQYQYDTSVNKINTVYGSLFNSPVTNQLSNDKKEQYIKNVQTNLADISKTDLSLSSNFTKATNIFKPFLEDTVLQADIASTKYYSDQIKKANSFKESTDPDISKLYNDDSVTVLNIGIKRLQNAKTPEEILQVSRSVTNTPFIEKFDQNEYLSKLAKEQGLNLTTENATGTGHTTTTQNGEQSIPYFTNWANHMLQNDPRYIKNLQLKAIVKEYNMLETGRQLGQTDEQIYSNYAETNYKETNKSYDEQIKSLTDLTKSIREKFEDSKLDADKKPKQFTPEEAAQMNQQADIIDRMLADYKQQIKNIQSKKEKFNSDWNVTRENIIKGLSNGSYFMDLQLSQDSNQWAKDWSNLHFKQEVKSDPTFVSHMNNLNAITLKQMDIAMENLKLQEKYNELAVAERLGMAKINKMGSSKGSKGEVDENGNPVNEPLVTAYNITDLQHIDPKDIPTFINTEVLGKYSEAIGGIAPYVNTLLDTSDLKTGQNALNYGESYRLGSELQTALTSGIDNAPTVKKLGKLLVEKGVIAQKDSNKVGSILNGFFDATSKYYENTKDKSVFPTAYTTGLAELTKTIQGLNSISALKENLEDTRLQNANIKLAPGFFTKDPKTGKISENTSPEVNKDFSQFAGLISIEEKLDKNDPERKWYNTTKIRKAPFKVETLKEAWKNNNISIYPIDMPSVFSPLAFWGTLKRNGVETKISLPIEFKPLFEEMTKKYGKPGDYLKATSGGNKEALQKLIGSNTGIMPKEYTYSNFGTNAKPTENMKLIPLLANRDIVVHGELDGERIEQNDVDTFMSIIQSTKANDIGNITFSTTSKYGIPSVRISFSNENAAKWKDLDNEKYKLINKANKGSLTFYLDNPTPELQKFIRGNTRVTDSPLTMQLKQAGRNGIKSDPYTERSGIKYEMYDLGNGTFRGKISYPKINPNNPNEKPEIETLEASGTYEDYENYMNSIPMMVGTNAKKIADVNEMYRKQLELMNQNNPIKVRDLKE